ncbi:hypothetical protein C6Y39_10160 [Alteromonas gracilis]|uniref:Uncharacterized protein n=1 Tax=Alteromonas gracilis TaxID=1479524 RepID=A0ABX5CMX6_9ALTE|nr:hypothetical protein C6Y39_10160 [Alteromonas gracilis]
MAYRFKFFAQPVISNVRTLCEAALVEFTIGLICAVFAYASYGIFIHLFVACVIISAACFCLSIYNLCCLFSHP